MKMPSPTWTMIYSASRRKHNHRCACCNKIVTEGEQIVMARLRSTKTKVLHTSCASNYATNGYNHQQLLEAQGMDYLASCGFSEAKKFVENSPIFKAPV